MTTKFEDVVRILRSCLMVQTDSAYSFLLDEMVTNELCPGTCEECSVIKTLRWAFEISHVTKPMSYAAWVLWADKALSKRTKQRLARKHGLEWSTLPDVVDDLENEVTREYKNG